MKNKRNLFIVITLGIVLFMASVGLYFFGNPLTGFAVFEDSAQVDFDNGIYTNTTYNGSSVVLEEGNLTGSYASQVFDASADASWDNITITIFEPYVEFLYAVDTSADVWNSSTGSVWSLLKDDYNAGDGNGVTYIVKNSSGSLFILYEQDLWKSDNNGIDWVKVNDDFNPGDSNAGLVIDIDGNDYIYIIDGSEEVFKSTDSGILFTSLIESYNDGQNAKGMASNSSNDLFTVDGLADVFSSIDEGVTWTKVNDDYNGAIGNDATDMVSNSSDALFILHNQDLWQSTDSGVTWTLVNDDYNGGSDTNSGQVIYIDSEDYIYIVDGGEDVYQSTDSGVSFSLLVSDLNGGNGNVLGLTSLNLLTDINFQVRSCDDSACSGESWTDIPNTSPQDLSLTDNRYFQYNVSFTSPDDSVTPLLENVTIGYSLLNSAPVISLVEPQNQLYVFNESLNLNFTTFDNDGNLEDCWYTLDSGITNVSIVNCQNTTFNISEGSHILEIYVNDSLGLGSDDSVSFNVDVTGISFSVSQPTGTKTSRTGIPINYNATGNNLTCWYEVQTSIGGAVIGNTTLDNCTGSNFAVSNDGDFVLKLYANNTLGSENFTSSSFSISTSVPAPTPSSGGGGGGGSSRSCQEVWTCAEWGDCLNNDTQTRICSDTNKCGTTSAKPIESKSCCLEEWGCTDWSSCVDETQTRYCTDENQCGTVKGKPEEIKSCARLPTGEEVTGGISFVSPFNLPNPQFLIPTSLLLITLIVLLLLRNAKLSKRMHKLITISHFVLIAVIVILLISTFKPSINLSAIGNLSVGILIGLAIGVALILFSLVILFRKLYKRRLQFKIRKRMPKSNIKNKRRKKKK
jgi:hypothetical protein